MKVVHLSSQDTGGAGKAAYRLHKGLRTIGVDSTMIVLHKNSNDVSVKVIPDNFPSEIKTLINPETYKSERASQNWIMWEKYINQFNSRPEGVEFFSGTDSEIILELIEEIRQADIINFHWMVGLIDYTNISSSLVNKQIVWTLHDMNPFTGGCHYSDGCSNFRSECGNCPQLGSDANNDLSAEIYLTKLKAYTNRKLNIISPSKWLAREASSSSLFNSYSADVIPYGLPLDVFKPYDKSEIRQLNEIGENTKIILFGAENVSNKRKGVSYLIEALNRLEDKQAQDIVLITFGYLSGDSPLKTGFKVINLGSIHDENQLAAIYSMADLFVLPSLEDNLPNTVLESLACGTPIVAFNVGGIPDMIIHKKTGYLVEKGNADELVEGINWVLNSGNNEMISINCREKALRDYPLHKQGEKYLKKYKSILNKEKELKTDSSANIESLKLEAEKRINDGEYDAAENLLSELRKRFPYDLEILNNIAALNIITKKWEDASSELKNILIADPENAAALENVVYLEQVLVLHNAVLQSEKSIKLKNYIEARKLLEEVLKNDPENTDALNNLAVIEISEGNYSQAQTIFNTILEKEPLNEIALDNIAYINESGESNPFSIDELVVVKENNNEEETDWLAMHAAKAIGLHDVRGKKCLIVGCNRGRDCSFFAEAGAGEVHGIDVIEEIGQEYQHPDVKYFKVSAEDMTGIKSDYYDLVFCFATMEHIPNIDLALSEMVRVTKPGGIIYSLASPLWNSKHGHHKGDYFGTKQWIHLRCSKEEIVDYSFENKLESSEIKLRQDIDYIMNPKFFNMTDAGKYLEFCNRLDNIEILANEIDFSEESDLELDLFCELRQSGYSRQEVLAFTHFFVAKKVPNISSRFNTEHSRISYFENENRNAEELITNNSFQAARKILYTVLLQDPENYDALNNLSVVAILEEGYQLAKIYLNDILSIKPDNETALGNLKYLNEKIEEGITEKPIENVVIDKSDSPVLSVIVQGRNDGYMGNFEWRLSTNLNKLSSVVKELSIEGKIEIILVDWGSENPLLNKLQLNSEAEEQIKIVRVNKELADKYNRDSEYSMVHAINTGIRRASGKYILFCDGDTYITTNVMNKMYGLLSGRLVSEVDLDNSLIMASRFHIPKSFQESDPSLNEIDKYIEDNYSDLDHDKINLDNFSGTATGYLMSRKLWFEYTAFDESLIYWGWFDIDLFNRVKTKYQIYDFEDHGMPFFHLEHYSDSKNRDMQAENPRKMNPGIMSENFAPNNSNWGLKNENLQLKKIELSNEVDGVDLSGSKLNNIIMPEIKDDEFYYEILNLASQPDVNTVLEIGSSAGGGSTEAFVEGLNRNPGTQMFCMEVSKTRFTELQERYKQNDFVKCYNVSSVAVEDFPSREQVRDFHSSINTTLNNYPVEQVLGWLDQDIDYIKRTGVDENGIQRIREDNNIQNFDLVLIDGSEFTGSAELEKIYGAKYILLDDINAYKNYESYIRLANDPAYNLVKENWNTRNGYAIFKFNDNELPVHFFTLVLNGEPFIRYHLGLLKQLPFKWYWHIIEGVADLKNDTAWSVPLGGKVSNLFHKSGRSIDGTSEYLNQIATAYPDKVTIYRKDENEFWNGKLEMVNAPLVNINEESLLFEIDSDELWSFDQLFNTRKMFIENPDKTAAFFWCHFYVGKNIVTTEKNSYSKNPAYEWIRAWRYNPGNRWISHEPPSLCLQNNDGKWIDLSKINPFSHDETEARGLVFHHYAYVLKSQLKFKEIYYGYRNSLNEWNKLQETRQFPVHLKDYFSWVSDSQQVNTLDSQNITPIATKDEKNEWRFNYLNADKQDDRTPEKSSPKEQQKIIIDGVIFQLQKNRPHGICRVWKSILDELDKTDIAERILLLDRGDTAPKFNKIKSRTILNYTYQHHQVDSHVLQDICEEENASFFISTYYTYPDRTHNALLLHDMIPEVMGWDFSNHQWQARSKAIDKANVYFSVSESTKNDFRKYYPDKSGKEVFVIYNAVGTNFKQADEIQKKEFRKKYELDKPYFIVSGNRDGYKNVSLFAKAFRNLPNNSSLQILMTGGAPEIDDELKPVLSGIDYKLEILADEELPVAYSGAIALVYPSKYEGFGLPILEAMNTGCPVITCKNSSIMEVAEQAVIYVDEYDTMEMKEALIEVQNQDVRNSMISKGYENTKRFSWTDSAEKYRKYIYKLRDDFWNLKKNTSSPLTEYLKPYYFIMKDDILGAAYSKLVELLMNGKHSEPYQFEGPENTLLEIEAREDYKSLLSSKDNETKDPFYSYICGLIHHKNGAFHNALEEYVEALNAGWTHWRIGYLAAVCAVEDNQPDVAGQLLRLVLEAKPEYSDAKELLVKLDNLKSKHKSSSLIKVSAIVSTYNSEKFIRGCLEDLLNQTLYEKGALEIIVVNSGSQENEKQIVEEYQKKYSNIKLISTEEKETIYKAWNRGVLASKGEYLTNANTDDRHKKDALEILSNELDANKDIALVYADAKVTQTENRNFDIAPLSGYLLYPEYNRKKLFKNCFMGPQPMWRKSLHDKYGFFDENLKSAGDYEFWLRCSEKENYKHVNNILGLYYLSMDSVENSDKPASNSEAEAAREKHWNGNESRPTVEGAYLIFYKESELQVKQPQFSVVLPTYNRPKQLHSALVSLENQTYRNFEVIVVNDGQDDLSGIVKEFEGKIYIRYLQHIINRERSASRNDAIKVANGKHITFLDDDDIYYPDHLKVLAQNIDQNMKVIYTDAVRSVYEKTSDGFKLNEQFVPYSINYDRNKLLIGNIAPINCFAVERSVAMQAGLFDENLNVLEDWEFLLRLSSLSEFKHIKQSTVEVTWKNDGSTTTSSKQDEFSRVREKIYKKYENEISHIPNKDEIINEFNAIWKNDFRKKEKEVSIIIITYNQLDYTKLLIDSIFKYTDKNYELIFIDNASADNTLSYLDELKNEFENVKIIRNRVNEGFPKAVNQGLLASTGDYVVLLNNDTVVNEGWLNRLITVAESDDTIGMVGPISNSVSWYQIDKEANYDSIEEMHRYANNVKEKNNNQVEDFPRIAFLCTLIKKKVIQKIGGLDERFSPGNYEDDDYCLRAQLAGFKTVIAKDVFVHHYGSKSFTDEGNDKYLELLEINKSKFIEKWGADPVQIWLKGAKMNKQEIKYPIEGNMFLEHFCKATNCINDEDFRAASTNLKIALENYSLNDGSSIIEYGTILNLAGNTALITGDYSLARKYFEEELKLKPDSSSACSGLGEVFFAEESYDASKTMFEWAVQNNPKNKSALRGLEKLDKILDQPESKSIKPDGNQNDLLIQAEIYLKEARQNFENKKFELALSLVEKAEQIINNGSYNGKERELSSSINNFKGFNCLALNLHDKAKKCFENALEIFPESSDACAGLAESFYKEIKFEESKTMYEWAVKNDSTNVFAFEGLKKVNRKLGYIETHNSLMVLS